MALHGCLKLEEVFYLLQNTAQLTMLRRYAYHIVRLIGFVTESRSVQPEYKGAHH